VLFLKSTKSITKINKILKKKNETQKRLKQNNAKYLNSFMFPHLRHLLPWHTIAELECFHKKIDHNSFPSGSCGKIHLNSKKDKFRFEKRKYLTEDKLCKDKDCVTTTTIQTWKKLDDWKYEVLLYKHSMGPKMIAFFDRFEVVVDEFATGYLKKVLECKQKYPKITPRTVKEYYSSSHFLLPKSYYDKKYNEMNSWLSGKIAGYQYSSNFPFFLPLLISGEEEDLAYLLTQLDLHNFDPSLGFSLDEVLKENISQYDGRCVRYFTFVLVNMYLAFNILIASGNFYNFEKWGKMDAQWFAHYSKSHELPYPWAKNLFTEDFEARRSTVYWEHETRKIFRSKDHEKRKYLSHILKPLELWKVEEFINLEYVPELLKKIFKFNYSLATVLKYAEEKFGYIPDYTPLATKHTFGYVQW
jgi:hypothetical protein